MRIFAATTFAQGEPESLVNVNYPRLLMSYHYEQVLTRMQDGLGYEPESWLYDSGAFTVWKKGASVDVEEYGAWCLERVQLGGDRAFINLDVIPGDPERSTQPTTRERNKAIKQSVENAAVLRGMGVPIMEVYHRFEPVKALDAICERRQPGELVGVGGLVGRGSSHAKVAFCDGAWHALRERYGWDNMIRVHGLGVAPDSKLGARYPWFSIDSTTWNHTGRFGRHVKQDGKMRGADTRTTIVSVRQLYFERMLERWRRLEVELGGMWAERGVTFVEEAATA